jgi:uncharacterized NAD(P)/FAD-binding protein YdhS
MRNALPSICVIGGGFTGIASAIACLERVKEQFRLYVVEPSASLGRGVAFGGHHPLHLLNVRTRDLSIHACRPGDFLSWAFRQLDQGENDAGLHESLAHTFLPRQLFGEYVRQRFSEMVERRKDVELDVVRAVATACATDKGRFLIHFDRAAPLVADVVILATAYGVKESSDLGALAPYGNLSSERLATAKSIVLIGSGLTMVDVLFDARREGFRGRAIVVSRRGQLPRAHAAKGVIPQAIQVPQFRRLSSLTAAVRIACEAAEAHGSPWQGIVNGLRASLQTIWQSLPVEDQARFLRHVRPFWDAHRHRLPIEVHASLQAEFEAGRAQLLQARVMDVVRTGDHFRLRLKHRASQLVEILESDLAFDCSGHAADLNLPLIQDLIAQGLARPDRHRLGLAIERNGQIQGADGCSTRGLFALGPLGQGSLWEITAVPEIVTQCDAAAVAIAAWATEEASTTHFHNV